MSTLYLESLWWRHPSWPSCWESRSSCSCPGAKGAPLRPAAIKAPAPSRRPHGDRARRGRVRASINRAIPWLEQTRVRPAQEGWGASASTSWRSTAGTSSTSSPTNRHRRNAIGPNWSSGCDCWGTDGLCSSISNAFAYPASSPDVLVLVMMAQHVDVQWPVITQALPELYQLGLDEPKRPIGIKIPLTWLAHTVGLTPTPSLEELRGEGCSGRSPASHDEGSDVYHLNARDLGLTDYGLRRGDFAPTSWPISSAPSRSGRSSTPSSAKPISPRGQQSATRWPGQPTPTATAKAFGIW